MNIIKKIFNRIKAYLQLFAVLSLSFNKNKIKGIEVTNAKIWLRNFRKRVLASPTDKHIGLTFKEFLTSCVYIEKELNFKINKDLIVICVIKNDIERLKVFLDYYRNLGVKQFAFLDDKSMDGTKEFLLIQSDVELFASPQDFQTFRKEAWINRILAYYGFNRWYLVADSDELLIYDNLEKTSVIQFIGLLEKEDVTAATGMMIDMYRKGNYNLICEENNNYIYDGFDYFDKNGYFYDKHNCFLPIFTGGMRHRCLNAKVCLVKTPLFFMDNKTIYFIHYLFPFKKNFQKIKSVALLHYKFAGNDFGKYKERVDRKNMCNDSEEYKIYLDKMEGNDVVNFYDENISEKFTGPHSLIKHGLMESIINKERIDNA